MGYKSCLWGTSPVCGVQVLFVRYKSCLWGTSPVCGVQVLFVGYKPCLWGLWTTATSYLSLSLTPFTRGDSPCIKSLRSAVVNVAENAEAIPAGQTHIYTPFIRDKTHIRTLPISASL